MALPLALVVMASMVKDAYEDYKRHQSDRSENEKTALVYDPSSKQFRKTQWKNICVGHIVQIKSEEFIPADILLLGTSDAKKICYVETKGLDGETNLKIKSV
jgi:phospholipid-transporting ATPase